jgi:hypothetical protein
LRRSVAPDALEPRLGADAETGWAAHFASSSGEPAAL